MLDKFTLHLSKRYFGNIFGAAEAFILTSVRDILVLFTQYGHASVNMTSMDFIGAELSLYFRNILFIFGSQEADFVDFSFGKPNNIICKIYFLIV